MPHEPPMTFTIDELRDLAILEGLPENALAWLATTGTRIDLNPGDRIFDRGQPADFMFIVAAGTIERREEIGGQWLVVATTTRGHVTGMLPFSRMTHYPGHAGATEPSSVLRIAKSDFNALLGVSHELGQRLVAEMADRVRGDVRLEQQRDKMMALGRLSAGLAHELNNPAAAIRRTVATLNERIAQQRALLETLSSERVDPAEFGRAKSILSQIRSRDRTPLGPIERSDREEEIADWLDERAIPDAWDAAATMTDTGFRVEDLEALVGNLPDRVAPGFLAWTVGSIDIDRMVAEIASAADRISDLVSAVKTYSHMDRSTEHRPTDIHVGLDNTLTMLRHRLKEKQVLVHRRYAEAIPPIPGHAGELNQVWTNLIDNAIDAVPDGGELQIVTVHDDWAVVIHVIDNGPGIPEEVQPRIFDPFFTTKDVSRGTGLGLDIARRIIRTHRGQIEVRSEPGRTEFRVRLPLAHAEETDSGSDRTRR